MTKPTKRAALGNKPTAGTVDRFPMTTESTEAESNQELLEGAHGNTDPRTLDDSTNVDRPIYNVGAYPPETMLYGPIITHEEYEPTTYLGTPKVDHYSDARKKANLKLKRVKGGY